MNNNFLNSMDHMENFEYMSQDRHEEISCGFFVLFRDTYEERMLNKEVLPSDKIGDKYTLIEDLLLAYFDYRRPIIPIRKIDGNITFAEFMDFINNEILHYVSEEHPELFIYDEEDGKYYLFGEDEDD